MRNKVLNRIQNKLGAPKLGELLIKKLKFHELQSFLLALFEEKVKKLEPKDVAHQYDENRFVHPALVDYRDILKFDQLAVDLLPSEIQFLLLSPVSPLGSTSAVTNLTQTNAITTIRNTEVSSDPTNALTLECVKRRKTILVNAQDSSEVVHLATSQRVIRTKLFEGKAMFPHFQLFGMCSAGKDTGAFTFESETLTFHLQYFLKLIWQSKSIGFNPGQVEINFFLYDMLFEDGLGRVLKALRTETPDLKVRVDKKSTSTYYQTIRYNIFIKDNKGEDHFVIDGGFTDWTQQYLSNRKERLLIGGFGSERFIDLFG